MIDTYEVDELEQRLRTALRAKAAQVDGASAGDALPVPVPVRTRPRAGRKAAAVFTTVVAIAAATALVVMATRPGARGAGVATAPATTVAPAASAISAPLLAPSWVPGGQQLWSVTAEPRVDLLSMSDQLFGTVAADGSLAQGLLVEFQSASDGASVGSGTAVTVRSVHGVTRDSKDAGTGTFAIEWIEGGADVRVTVRGATLAEALSAIDALRPRGPDLMSGFDAAADPNGYALLGERMGSTSHPNVAATFEYAETPGARPDFTVLTYTGQQYPDYLRVWIAGAREADGSTFERDPQAGYYVAWSDGREVIVRARDASVDPSVLDRIAHSATTLDEHDAAALMDEAQARLAAWPATGTVALASGVVDLRGNGAASTVCLAVPGFDPACADPFVEDAAGIDNSGALPGHAGSAVIDGHWYVFAATDADVVVSGRLPVERGVIGSTHVALVAVPDSVDRLNTLLPVGNGESVGTGFIRPTS